MDGCSTVDWVVSGQGYCILYNVIQCIAHFKVLINDHSHLPKSLCYWFVCCVFLFAAWPVCMACQGPSVGVKRLARGKRRRGGEGANSLSRGPRWPFEAKPR